MPILIKLAPYLIGISTILGVYTYIQHLKNENEILNKNTMILKQNQINIVSAYENSIIAIEKKAYDEGLNKASSLISKDLVKKIETENQKRNFNEINNSIYRTTSF